MRIGINEEMNQDINKTQAHVQNMKRDNDKQQRNKEYKLWWSSTGPSSMIKLKEWPKPFRQSPQNDTLKCSWQGIRQERKTTTKSIL